MYNIICDSIGIEPRPNNGTLRLPLKPVGLHSDKPDMPDDTPIDFPPDNTSANAPEASHPANDKLIIIEEDQSTGEQKETKVEMDNFWAYLKAKMAAAREWAKKVLASLKNNHKDGENESKSFDQSDAPA